ncbi:FAD-dependent oxidoreductase [Streptomyces sp. NPDC127190]|uniref:FAD-dependent oxidoreductase n=1 Tax=unclassified Streptomyces TaxID=2593676 RepID=UPI003632A065
MLNGTENTCDVVILGVGSGGYAAASRAAGPGLSVALAEQDRVGGTRLHRGCIPTTAPLRSAAVADSAREPGIRSACGGMDMPGVTAYKDSVVDQVLTDRHIALAAGSVPAATLPGEDEDSSKALGRAFSIEGILVAERLAGLDPAPIDDDGVPRVTCAQPEVAPDELDRTGSTEDPALSVAGELIGEARPTVDREALHDDVASFLHAHPTQSETPGEAHPARTGKPLHAHD